MTLALAAFAVIGCMAAEPPAVVPAETVKQEAETMADRGSPSRRAPAEVAPVELDGVRYEQVRYGDDVDPADPNGWLRATSIADGSVLWTKQLYTAPPDTGRGRAHIYFRSMVIGPDGKSIVVVSEANDTFKVDPATGEFTQID